MISFVSEGSFIMSAANNRPRVRVYEVRSPTDMKREELGQWIRQTVLIDDTQRVIYGVESYTVVQIRAGTLIGLAVVEP